MALPTRPTTVPIQCGSQRDTTRMCGSTTRPMLHRFNCKTNSLTKIAFDKVRTSTRSHTGRILIRIATRTNSRGATNSIGLFTRIDNNHHVPHLTILISSITLALRTNRDRTMSFSMPFRQLVSRTSSGIHIAFTLATTLGGSSAQRASSYSADMDVIVRH